MECAGSPPAVVKNEAVCGCGRAAECLCCCKFPGLPLLPLCVPCSIQHFTQERGDHQQLPLAAHHFVTSINTYREAILRINKYEMIKRKLEINAQTVQHSEQLLTEAAAQIIAKVEKIKATSLSTLQHTHQAVNLGKDKIVETMEKQLFEVVPYFPSVEETNLFRFELGLEAVERALEGFAQVPRSKYDMDLSDIMKKEDCQPCAEPATPAPPSVPILEKPKKTKKYSKAKSSGRRCKLDFLKTYVLPPSDHFRCSRHGDVFWTAKALVKHLRVKHEKFRPDMLPSNPD